MSNGHDPADFCYPEDDDDRLDAAEAQWDTFREELSEQMTAAGCTLDYWDNAETYMAKAIELGLVQTADTSWGPGYTTGPAWLDKETLAKRLDEWPLNDDPPGNPDLLFYQYLG